MVGMEEMRSHIVVIEREGELYTDLLDRVFKAVGTAYKTWYAPESHLHHKLDAWVHAHGMGKIGRRGKLKDFEKILAELPDCVVLDDVLVTPPLYRSEQPKALSRTQLAGWKTNVTCPVRSPYVSTAAIEVSADISVGKAIGAVGHVASQLATWPELSGLVEVGVPVRVGVTEHGISPLQITDAGHTEVEPGTVTARFRYF